MKLSNTTTHWAHETHLAEMLDKQLTNAGFYEIASPENSPTGITLIRPGRRESVRVFLPHDSTEVEVYTGSLRDGRLVYQGPAEMAAQLTLLTDRSN